jgi:predicted homoserine dehydrogenase-like protein
MDATIGFALRRMADAQGVVYSNTDGDQPGVLARMITDVKLMGFKIAAAGNGKGFSELSRNTE